MSENFREDHDNSNDSYDPDKDGYYPDNIYEAPKGYRPPKKQPKVRLDEFEPTGPEKHGSTRSRILTTVCFSCAVVSLALSVLALVFAFSSAWGLVINVVAFILAWVSAGTGVASWSGGSFIGIPRGRLSRAALILAVTAFLVSSVLFAVTGCGACFSCGRSLI